MIFRRLPQNTIPIYVAMRMAFNQNNLVGGATVLTADTISRLNTIFPQYQNGIKLINLSKSESECTTAIKSGLQADCALWTSDFLDAVLKAVRRGLIAETDLSLYGLTVSNPVMPSFKSEQDVLTAAENAVAGETARVAKGGAPIPFPTAAEVNTRNTDFGKALDNRNIAKKSLDDAQEALQALNPEAEKVIKKIWDEAETFYNEESDESRRANCRPWGVVYISDTRIEVRAQALAVQNGKALPLPLAIMSLNTTDDEDKADENGNLLMKTGVTGTAIISITCEGYITQEFTKEFTGKDDMDLGEVTMVAV